MTQPRRKSLLLGGNLLGICCNCSITRQLAYQASHGERRYKPGDFVKICFCSRGNGLKLRKNEPAEHMWVKVTQVLQPRDAEPREVCYYGLLDSQPCLLPLKLGSRVAFSGGEVSEAILARKITKSSTPPTGVKRTAGSKRRAADPVERRVGRN